MGIDGNNGNIWKFLYFSSTENKLEISEMVENVLSPKKKIF